MKLLTKSDNIYWGIITINTIIENSYILFFNNKEAKHESTGRSADFSD